MKSNVQCLRLTQRHHSNHFAELKRDELARHLPELPGRLQSNYPVPLNYMTFPGSASVLAASLHTLVSDTRDFQRFFYWIASLWVLPGAQFTV